VVQVVQPDPEIGVYLASVEALVARAAWVEVERATLDFERSLQQPPHSESFDGTIMARVDVPIL
jgi:hypothetical protein